MKVLTRKRQQDIYKRIVDVIVTLTKVEAISEDHALQLDYALGDMWQIVRMVGGREMLTAMEGRNYHTTPKVEKILNGLSDCIDAADGWIDDLTEVEL